MKSRSAPEVVVIGAGVIGLSAAVCVAERGLRVEVRARLAPAQTTSAVAPAMVGPAMAPAESAAGRRERASIAELTALADVPYTGVTIRRGRLASRQPGPSPPGDMVPCASPELPQGFAAAFWATLPLVGVPIYLDYLAGRLAAGGGRIELRAADSLAELAAEAPLIINCAGLGARELTDDDSLTPVRGQHLIVENPGLEEFFIEAPFTPEWAAYWPYPDHVVLGGTQSTANTSTEPDPQIAEQILERCIEVEPRLADAQVRGHQVGLRPARPTVRLEAEQIGQARCVHNYGHGGSGVTLSRGRRSRPQRCYSTNEACPSLGTPVLEQDRTAAGGLSTDAGYPSASEGYPRLGTRCRATLRSARGPMSAARRTRSRAPSGLPADPPPPGSDAARAVVRACVETVWRSFAIVEVETSRRSAMSRCVNPCSRRARACVARSAGFRRPVRGRLGTPGD